MAQTVLRRCDQDVDAGRAVIRAATEVVVTTSHLLVRRRRLPCRASASERGLFNPRPRMPTGRSLQIRSDLSRSRNMSDLAFGTLSTRSPVRQVSSSTVMMINRPPPPVPCMSPLRLPTWHRLTGLFTCPPLERRCRMLATVADPSWSHHRIAGSGGRRGASLAPRLQEMPGAVHVLRTVLTRAHLRSRGLHAKGPAAGASRPVTACMVVATSPTCAIMVASARSGSRWTIASTTAVCSAKDRWARPGTKKMVRYW